VLFQERPGPDFFVCPFREFPTFRGPIILVGAHAMTTGLPRQRGIPVLRLGLTLCFLRIKILFDRYGPKAPIFQNPTTLVLNESGHHIASTSSSRRRLCSDLASVYCLFTRDRVSYLLKEVP
jgi:hypothetical protein